MLRGVSGELRGLIKALSCSDKLLVKVYLEGLLLHSTENSYLLLGVHIGKEGLYRWYKWLNILGMSY